MDYEEIINEYRKELDQLGVEDDDVGMMNQTEADLLVISLKLQRRLNALEKNLPMRMMLGF